MRKQRAIKRPIIPDPLYQSTLITQFIRQVMKKGKKNLAQKIVYSTLSDLEKKNKTIKPLETFEKALENLKPLLELRSRKVGGARYQIPVKVTPERQITLALR